MPISLKTIKTPLWKTTVSTIGQASMNLNSVGKLSMEKIGIIDVHVPFVWALKFLSFPGPPMFFLCFEKGLSGIQQGIFVPWPSVRPIPAKRW